MQIKDKRTKAPIEEVFCAGWNRYETLHLEQKIITPEAIPQTSLRAMQVAISTESIPTTCFQLHASGTKPTATMPKHPFRKKASPFSTMYVTVRAMSGSMVV